MTARTAQSVLARAGEILSSTRDRAIALEPCTDPRYQVVRCAVEEPGAPARGARPDGDETVIVKYVPGSEDFDPEDRDPQRVSSRFFNEWAAFRFLEQVLPDAENPAPRLLAVDGELALLVIEDRPGDNLEVLLRGDRSSAAGDALLAFARALARVQVGSRGEAQRYRRLRRGLGPEPEPEERRLLTGGWLRENLREIDENFRALGFRAPSGFFGELEAVASAMDGSEPFQVFSHGDPTASNFLVDDRGSTLIDYEFAGFAYGACDAATARMLFPTSTVVNRVPEGLVEDFEAVFREEHTGADPAIDRAAFDRALLHACAYWLAIRLAGSLRHPEDDSDRRAALGRDAEWETSSIRQIVLARLAAFVGAAERFDGLPETRAVSERLERDLKRLWEPLAAMPFFPCFAKSS